MNRAMLTQRVVRRDRARAARRGLVLGGLAGLGAVALAAAAACWLPGLDLFRLREVEIRLEPGARRVSRLEVLDLARVPAGGSLLALGLDEVAARVGEHPWAGEVVVRRQLPGRLVIEVAEHRPAAIVQLDRLYYADTAGRIFKPVEPGEPTDLAVVTGLGAAAVAADPARAASRLVQAMVLLDLAGRRLPVPVSEVHLDEVRGFVVRTAAPGLAIAVGQGPFGPRLDRAVRVLAYLAAAGVRVEAIDVTYEHRAVARKRPEASQIAARKPLEPPARGASGGSRL